MRALRVVAVVLALAGALVAPLAARASITWAGTVTAAAGLYGYSPTLGGVTAGELWAGTWHTTSGYLGSVGLQCASNASYSVSVSTWTWATGGTWYDAEFDTWVEDPVPDGASSGAIPATLAYCRVWVKALSTGAAAVTLTVGPAATPTPSPTPVSTPTPTPTVAPTVVPTIAPSVPPTTPPSAAPSALVVGSFVDGAAVQVSEALDLMRLAVFALVLVGGIGVAACVGLLIAAVAGRG